MSMKFVSSPSILQASRPWLLVNSRTHKSHFVGEMIILELVLFHNFEISFEVLKLMIDVNLCELWYLDYDFRNKLKFFYDYN